MGSKFKQNHNLRASGISAGLNGTLDDSVTTVITSAGRPRKTFEIPATTGGPSTEDIHANSANTKLNR